jgi:ABC-type transport system involved in Fe-S cluster assembly fused permease/ATPase subunit
MDKDLDKLFEETEESGAKAIERLNITIFVSLAFMAFQIAMIIGILCLIYLDMAPVLRIIWMVLVFGYIGVLIIGSIVKLVKAIKTKNYVKTTAKTVEIMHDLMSGIDSKDA